MTKKEIIAAFEQAEKDWRRPQRWWQMERGIRDGLCHYFASRFNLSNFDVALNLKPLWIKYRTIEDSNFHFNNREERLEAIRRVLNDLKENK